MTFSTSGFSWISSPKAPEFPIGVIENFYEYSRKYSHDTGDKLFTGVNDTGKKLIAGVV